MKKGRQKNNSNKNKNKKNLKSSFQTYINPPYNVLLGTLYTS